MCLGLPEKMINDIVQLNGEGILFVCLNCRINKQCAPREQRTVTGDNNQEAAIKQLYEMVMALCGTVRSLSDKIEGKLIGWHVLMYIDISCGVFFG